MAPTARLSLDSLPAQESEHVSLELQSDGDVNISAPRSPSRLPRWRGLLSQDGA